MSFSPVSSLCAIVPLVLMAPAPTLRAQTSAVVDEGTFTISQQGAPLGREAFRIVRALAPGGQIFRATGQSALGGSRVTTSLGTDSLGVPVSYESELTQRGEMLQRLKGSGRPGRLSVLMQTKTGESAREYVLTSGTLLMDEDVIHHYFFVPLAAQNARVGVISPRVGQQMRLQLESRGEDTIDVAGAAVSSRHFALTGTPGPAREIWIDSKGRLLKVTIPAKGWVAVRDDPPR